MSRPVKKGSLGEILSACKIITEEDIEAALELQERSGMRLGEALIALGFVTQEDIDWALSNQLDLPYIRLKHDMIDPEAIQLIPATTARKFNLIPLIKAGGELNIAISDPLNKAALAAVAQQSGCQVNVSVALIREIREMIDICYGCSVQESLGFSSAAFSPAALEIINGDLTGGKLLDYLLIFTMQNRLSALSLQPMGELVQVVGRRNGTMHPVGTLGTTYYPDFIRKIRRSIDTGIRNDQQCGGKLTFSYRSQPTSFTINLLPGYGGDYVTIHPTIATTLPEQRSELHLLPEQERSFDTLSQATRGITFFASPLVEERNRFMELMLKEITTTGKNVIFLGEGAVKSGGQFPRIPLPSDEAERGATIRSVMSHDPDILVIEDATEPIPFAAACQLAREGKLVLAGLAIRGMTETMSRLLMYRELNYFLPPVVNGLLAWQGIQLLCPHCRAEYTPATEELPPPGRVSPPAFYRSAGCDLCSGSGLGSRRFLLDILPFTAPFLQQFYHATTPAPLREQLAVEGYRGSEEAAAQLLTEGDISPGEYRASVIL